MTRQSQPWRTSSADTRRGFTLIELILVLGLLAVVLTVTTPALSNFFEGRRAREEARRFLALTRFGRVEAVSRSVPMELWIEGDSYGLRPRLSSEPEDDLEAEERVQEFQIADGLKMDVDKTQRGTGKQAQAVILFHPDGTIDEDESLQSVTLTDKSGRAMFIERSDVGIGFILMDEEEARNLRRR